MLKICCSHYLFSFGPNRITSRSISTLLNIKLCFVCFGHILYIQLFWEQASSLQLRNLGNLVQCPKHIFQEINSIDQNVPFCRWKDALCQEFQCHCNFFLHMEGCTTWHITFLAIFYTWKSFCWNISSMLDYHMAKLTFLHIQKLPCLFRNFLFQRYIRITMQISKWEQIN